MSKPITEQIDEYCRWKFLRSPWIAGAQFSLLTRFAKEFNIRSVSDIQEDHIAFYTGEQLTEFYSEQCLRAIRGFLWYSRQAGYQCIASQMATKENLQKHKGRPVNWEMVKEVKKGKGTIREIAKDLEEKFNRPVHPSQVHRWKSLIPRLQ